MSFLESVRTRSGLAAPLLCGLIALAGASSAPSPARALDAGQDACAPFADPRPDFMADLYWGLGIDNFASRELALYLNPELSGDKMERGVGGFDFAYRIGGLPKASAVQLWIYGETVHGVRSADIDCRELDEDVLFRLTGVSNPGERTLFMLRNATSLEGMLGLRLELRCIHPRGRSPSVLYAYGQLGMVSVAGSGQDVMDTPECGLGMRCIAGSLRESFLQIGRGRTDFFPLHREPRIKIDALLNWHQAKLDALGLSMFGEITVDADFGPGSDSIQSYFGFLSDLDRFFPGAAGAK